MRRVRLIASLVIVTACGLWQGSAGKSWVVDRGSGIGDRGSWIVVDVPAEAVRAAADTFFARRFPDQAGKLEVRVLQTGGAAESAGPLEIRLRHAEGVPRGHTNVRLYQEGTDIGWALLYVAYYDSVAVAGEDIAAGDAVDSSDLSFAWMDVTDFRGDPLSPSMLSSYREKGGVHAARPLRAGDALRSSDLRPPLAADTGDTVLMTYRKGTILLRLSCRAREPGVEGDEIRLYGADTKTTYKARLTGPGQAVWTATL